MWLFPPLVIGFLALRGMYRPKITLRILDEAAHVVGATSVAAMVDRRRRDVPGRHDAQRRADGARLGLRHGLRVGRPARDRPEPPPCARTAARRQAHADRRRRPDRRAGRAPARRAARSSGCGRSATSTPTRRATTRSTGRHVAVLGGPTTSSEIVRETGAEHVVLAFLSSRGSDAKLVPDRAPVRRARPRGLARAATVRVDQRPRGTRAHRRDAPLPPAHGPAEGLAVRGQARARPRDGGAADHRPLPRC